MLDQQLNSIDEIIFGKTLNSKLLKIKTPLIQMNQPLQAPKDLSSDFFGRDDEIKLTKKRIKFPSLNKIEKDNYARAFALASFANHELQAIECMAYAIKFLWQGEEVYHGYIRGLISAIEDEQKHFELYQKQINILGYEIGEFPKNDFFLRNLEPIRNLQQFSAMMHLTFESANLDFAFYYRNFFSSMGFAQIAQCLDIVLKDEIGHVSLGKIPFSVDENGKDLWTSYTDNLVHPLTPARARGINYQPSLRKLTGLGDSFISQLTAYEDSYQITKRKK